MHEFYKQYKQQFIDEDGKVTKFTDVAIGYDEIEQDIKRSKTSRGLTLNIIQNLEFIGKMRDYILQKYVEKGVYYKIISQNLKSNFNDFELASEGVLSLKTLKYDDIKATCDFRESKFDEVFRANIKEVYELDRSKDIEGRTLPAIEKKFMQWRSKEIFLRSELRAEPYNNSFVSDVTITPMMVARPVSDDDVTSTYDPFVADPIGGADVSVSNMFLIDNSRPKFLKLNLDIDVSISAYTLAQIHIYRYNTDSLAYVERIQIGSNFTTSGQDVVFNSDYEIEVGIDDYLMLGIDIDSGTYTVDVNTCNIIVEEDSFYEPLNSEDRTIEVLPIYNAFERIVKIMDSTVNFKSDYIQENWSGLVVTLGQTIRHMERGEEKVSFLKASFEQLYKATHTVDPIAYGIRLVNNITTLEIEHISTFFGDDEIIDFGLLSDLETEVNNDLIYGSIKVGYSNSEKIEDVFGYQATHGVNTWSFPVNDNDNVYDATCDAIADPVQAELTFRKQFSEFPDEDWKYDKDLFVFDCGEYTYPSTNIKFFIPYAWQEHFASQPTGVYSPDTGYNYRLSPVNCLYRHDINFNHEYAKNAYETKQLQFTDTTGNAELSTTLISGTARKERDDINISDLRNGLFEPLTVSGKASLTDLLYGQLNGKEANPNIYQTCRWRYANGAIGRGYIESVKIKNGNNKGAVTAELTKKNGF